MSLNSINGLIFSKMIISAANTLNENKKIVDSLNVFPVPDGDTGTNMSLTAIAAAQELEKLQNTHIGEVCEIVAKGSLRGARGNSGVILSQLLRGFAKSIKDKETVTTKDLALAFQQGSQTAYKAVMKPKEGTILTVARACADSALIHSENIDDIEEFLIKVLSDGNEMLLKTKDMLPILKQADVVDAGGKGLLYLLEGAIEGLKVKDSISLNKASSENTTDFKALTTFDHENITFGYCTEFFIVKNNVSNIEINGLKSFCDSVGDSLVVVADDEIVKVHVHTDHPGDVIEHALKIGPLDSLKIDNMRIQHQTKTNATQQDVLEKPEKLVGFISVCAGKGLSEIFIGLGADVIIEGGQTMNPSTDDIINAINKVNAKTVFVLPNNKNIILAAQQAAKLVKNKKVMVVPSQTIPQGINALISFDGGDNLEKTFKTMENAIEVVTTCTLTYAVRDTVIDNKEIKEGDFLGMIDGKIKTISSNIDEGIKKLLSQAINNNSELISIYYGEEISESESLELKEFFEKEYPQCEVELNSGGQPLYYYIISVE